MASPTCAAAETLRGCCERKKSKKKRKKGDRGPDAPIAASRQAVGDLVEHRFGFDRFGQDLVLADMVAQLRMSGHEDDSKIRALLPGLPRQGQPVGLTFRHDDIRREKIDRAIAAERVQCRHAVERRDDAVAGLGERSGQGISQGRIVFDEEGSWAFRSLCDARASSTPSIGFIVCTIADHQLSVRAAAFATGATRMVTRAEAFIFRPGSSRLIEVRRSVEGP